MLAQILFTPFPHWTHYALLGLRVLGFWGVIMLCIRLRVRRYSRTQRIAQAIYAIALLLVMIVDGNAEKPLSLITLLFNVSLIGWTFGALLDIGSNEHRNLKIQKTGDYYA